jgi:hypothetical protein
MSRRKFAGVTVTITTAADAQLEPPQARRVVALGWISRQGGQITISDQLTGSTLAAANRTVAP